MKIGIYDPYLDTLSGGEKYMLSIASCFTPEHEVFIFWDKTEEEKIKSLSLKKLGIDLSNIKFYNNIFHRKNSTASRFIESRKFDAIIYLSDGSIPFVGTKLYIHFQFPVEWVNSLIKTRIKLFFVKRIFCNSYFTKYFIDKKLRVKSIVLYPPVKIGKSGSGKKENVILHVGRFYADQDGVNYKKQDVMIGVFKKMVDNGLKDWRFSIVVGVKDEDKNNFLKLKELSKGYPIEIIENPTNEILWKNYERSKIYWHATGFQEDLKKFPEKAEHFGISTVEAMGAGAVPVAINAGGQKEIINDGKDGYLWNTLEDLIEKTDSLVKNDKLWKNMSEKAKEKSKLFSEERFCGDLKNIIQ